MASGRRLRTCRGMDGTEGGTVMMPACVSYIFPLRNMMVSFCVRTYHIKYDARTVSLTLSNKSIGMSQPDIWS